MDHQLAASILKCCRLLLGVFVALPSIACAGFAPDEWLLGYGQSVPGWGETEETVKAADFVARWKIPVRGYAPGSKWFGVQSHEVWLEGTLHGMISDSDANDDHDIGFVDFAFLAAFILEPLGEAEPFVFAGGGPAYIFADIRGVGMDLTANYQVGLGIRNTRFFGQPTEFLLKFHHISNMSLANPNVSMNSLRFQVSLPF